MAGVRPCPSRVAVVFSSGFFGFFAHAGFLSALRDLGIIPCGYGGASSGAIVAAMAAADMTDSAIRAFLFKVVKSDFWDPDPWRLLLKKALTLLKGYTGYLRGEGFARLLEDLPVKRIEECPFPLAIVATNLTRNRETVFTRGDLREAVRASGAVPWLFKPVEIDGALYVDGGIVTKAPVKAVVDLVSPGKIIIHFIGSQNLEEPRHSFLKKRATPWHIQHLAGNIARQEAYGREVELVKLRGIEVVEVRTHAPAVSPNGLEKGKAAYEAAKAEAVKVLSGLTAGLLP